MSTNVGTATLSVIPSFDGFERRLESGTSRSLTSVGTRSGSRFGSTLGKSTGAAFGKTFRTAAKIGIAGALAVTAGAIKLGADAIGEAREAQEVARQTNAVLKSTGRSAKVSAKDVGKLAGRLSYMAGVDDELIQAGENVLLTFKDVRNEAGKGNKIFDKATKVALNMSTALGTDLKGANIQVGKALNDPIKGITALTRVGVTFTDQQKDQIKTLVESGDKLGAQKLILKELGSEFGGSARSQASATDRLKVAFGNVQEQLGKGLLPIVQDFSRFLLREGVPAMKEFVGWFTDEGLPAIKDLGKKLQPLGEKLLPLVVDGFKSIKNFAEDALPFAEGIVGAFNDMPGWVKKVLAGGVIGGTVAVKLGGADLFKRGATPLNPLYVSAVGGLGGSPGGKVGSAASKIPIIGEVLVTAGIGLAALHDFHRGDDKNSLASLGRGNINEFLDDKLPTWLGGDVGKKKIEALGAEWDETRNQASDYFRLIEQHKNVQLRFTVNGFDLATRDAREYLALLLQIRGTVIENKLDAAGGSGPTQPSDDGKGGGKPSGRVIAVTNHYNVNTTKDAEIWDKRRRQQVAMGGFG